MNRKLALPALLSLCLLAVPPLAMADEAANNDHMTNQQNMDHGNMHRTDVDRPGMEEHHGGEQGYDPVQRTEKHLGLLEKELKLNADQQSAWKAYSDSIMGFAKEKSERMEQFREERSELNGMDMASQLDKMAQLSRSRADRLEKLASETRTFQQSLTPEQQTTFNEFWKQHVGYGKGKRHHPS